MHLLILGYSSIAERRVIPAAGRVDAVTKISIASRSRARPSTWPKAAEFFSDYDQALATDVDAVYLSLPNSMHEAWALAALSAGKHVLVDKPAMLSMAGSQRAVAAARDRRLLLAEATVFCCHPHVDALVDFVSECGPLTHVNAQFIIPPLPSANFRNHANLGGGCLLDMGSYAAALIRLLGQGIATDVAAFAGPRHAETGVDLGFSVLARLANGAMFTGQFSFEGEYQNRLIVVAKAGSAEIERVFSPPADLVMTWQQRRKNVARTVTFEPADTFGRFLESATQAIATDNREPFYSDLLADAEMRSRFAQAIDQGTRPQSR